MRSTYAGIEVRDLDRSIRFHTEGLGMEPTGRFTIPATDSENADLRSPGSEQVLELNRYPEGSALDHIAFDVQDEAVDAVVARLEALGGKWARPTDVQPTHDPAFAEDPNGIWIKASRSKT